MGLQALLKQANWTGAVSAASLSALLRATEQDVTNATSIAIQLDEAVETMRLLTRSISTRSRRFTSPAAILSGGVVREIAGVVTLPETRRVDAARASDGSLRAIVSLSSHVGSVKTVDDPVNVFDTDSATAWSIHIESPVIPTLSFSETGEIEAAYMVLDVQFDTPQILSQMELGILGDPALLIRVVNAETDEVLWSGKRWVNPGALVFFNSRTSAQSVRIHLLQPHSFYTGRTYQYQTAITSLSLLDVEYEVSSNVLMPSHRIASQMLRPLLSAEGDCTLEINLDGAWTVIGDSFMLPTLSKQEEVPVSVGGTVFLADAPDELQWILVRKQSGQTVAIDLGQVQQSGNTLLLPDANGAIVAIVAYRYRPSTVDSRIRMTRGSNVWTSPTLKEVRMR